MLADLSITQFMEKTASDSPFPGGGSVAALSAATSASLVEMVANLTIGKKGCEEVEPVMKKIARDAETYRNKLIKDIDRDSDAYSQVMNAFQLPKSTDQEKNARTAAIQEALKHACLVPLEVAEDAFEVIELAGEVVAKGNKNAVTDGLVGAMMARTAVLSALYNVKINLASIKDKEFADDIADKVKHMETEVGNTEKKILSAGSFDF
ncbi:MAG: cyclodeaminase/cyclohydrolase family protein [Desulfobacteraceae bacterium]|nr:cyclodeaminase/cyclohydrolase family protein [Desulfobacteraceae bacterium]